MTTPKILPFRRWPDGDRLAWEAAVAPGDVLSAGGGAAHWAPKTSKQVKKRYGRWLAYLELKGELDPRLTPIERATPDAVRAFVASMLAEDLSTVTVHSTLRDVKIRSF